MPVFTSELQLVCGSVKAGSTESTIQARTVVADGAGLNLVMPLVLTQLQRNY